MRHPARPLALALATVLGACAHLGQPSAPAQPWQQVVDPAEAGFSPAGLEAAFDIANRSGSAAVMVVSGGDVVAAWGDVGRELELHSVRKSLYSALYGVAVERRLLSLDATLAALGVDDLQPLSAAEKGARVEDLLAARSGVFHPSAYSPKDMDAERPPRGAHAPGTHFFYNNWDFNVAAAVLEQASGGDLYATFDRWLARPLGMEDWQPSDGYRAFEPRTSRWPAHTFRMSARDLARIGVLYAQRGSWRGKQVLPAAWVEASTQSISTLPGGGGYGFMWWVYPPESVSGETYPHLRDERILLARGTGGQALFVLPDRRLVVVHRADTDQGKTVAGKSVWSIVEAVVAAAQEPAAKRPRLGALAPRPLPAAPPPVPPIATAPAPPAAVEPLLGRYQVAPGVVAEVFLFQGLPYVEMPGEGEAEIFLQPDGSWRLRVDPVRFDVERDAAGSVVALRVDMGGGEMRAPRLRE